MFNFHSPPKEGRVGRDSNVTPVINFSFSISIIFFHPKLAGENCAKGQNNEPPIQNLNGERQLCV